MTTKLYRSAGPLYNGILEEILNWYKVPNTPATRASFLQKLKPSAIELWDSYRKQDVNTDYSKREIQAAYMLRYFVPYTLPLNALLHEHDAVSNEKSNFAACFVGAGPGPEAIGLLSYLEEKHPGQRGINFHLIDKTKTIWDASREITFGKLASIVAPSLKLNWKAHALDLTKTHTVSGKIDLLVFQNCLNEISHAGFTPKLLKTWSDALKPGASLIFIDRTGYPAVAQFLSDAADILIKKGFRIAQSDYDATIDVKPCTRAMPSCILESLLYYPASKWTCGSDPHGLILASDVKYLKLMLINEK